jgi:hypothetical protein
MVKEAAQAPQALEIWKSLASLQFYASEFNVQRRYRQTACKSVMLLKSYRQSETSFGNVYSEG